MANIGTTVDSLTICGLTQPFINQIMDSYSNARKSPTNENIGIYEEKCNLLSTQIAILYFAGANSSALYNPMGIEHVHENIDNPDYDDTQKMLDKIWLESLKRNFKTFNINGFDDELQEALSKL